ncbi:hypothetical protein PQR02_29900 [Paraburkholderia sediminicola]|uniref:hypothetical protein n=1 Tax=Paraburkholderia sediminicola TaxID=458836 RepID=UPI0038BB5F0F
MAQQLMSQIGQSKTGVVHEIVQHALRIAATASTSNGAIDALGDALLQVERLVTHRSVRTDSALICGTAGFARDQLACVW